MLDGEGSWSESQSAVELHVVRVLGRFLVREMDWFRPRQRHIRMKGLETPPMPTIESISERPGGLVRQADAHWGGVE